MSPQNEVNHVDRRIDPLTLSKTPIDSPIPPSLWQAALQRPPFLPVPGALNIRDLGLVPGSKLRKGYIFRSGFLNHITPQGRDVLVEHLGVKRVFDLRSKAERAKNPDPEIEGVRNVWVEGVEEVPQVLDPRNFARDGGKEGYRGMYGDVLTIQRSAFRGVLEVIKDGGKGAMVFHCTAGKDRTGVLAAVILSIAGCSREAIATDYALTRVGVEPAREVLLAVILKWLKDGDLGAPGVREMCGIKYDTMIDFLEFVDGKYEGGLLGYVKELGFSEEDVQTMRRNLTEQ